MRRPSEICVFLAHFGIFCLVFLVLLSVIFENSGFMKAGPGQKRYEPSEGKVVKFSDVHGVDEAKDVRIGYFCLLVDFRGLNWGF